MIMWVLPCEDTGSAGAAKSAWHILQRKQKQKGPSYTRKIDFSSFLMRIKKAALNFKFLVSHGIDFLNTQHTSKLL